MRIALIGAGRMGVPMGRRLLRSGHELTVSDRAPAAVRALVSSVPAAPGAPAARAAGSPAEAATGAELTLVSLPTPSVVESVLLGPGGALAACASGSLLLDMSTGPPDLARRLAAAGASQGVAVLDAPVSGGPLGAAAGTLAVMVGGEADAYERARSVLDVLGDTVAHLGPAGAGQAAKLVNNLLAAAQMATLGEAVALARAERLDPARLFTVLCGASGDSRVLRQRFPVPGVLDRAPASHGWRALFPTDLLVKDVRLALDAAAAHGLGLPMAETALARYAEAQARGWGGLDYSAVARVLDQE